MRLPIFLLALVSSMLVGCFPHITYAAAWWGGGSRKDDWVLERGGAMIFYQVKDESNNPQYSARLYLDDILIETEKNARGVFDDAINNKYRVDILKDDRAVASTEVDVRPSENFKLIFDLDTGQVSQESTLLSVSKIRLSPDSSRYIAIEDIEKLRDEEIERVEKELKSLNDSLAQKFEEATRKNALQDFLFGPKEEIVEEAEERLNTMQVTFLQLKDLEEGVVSEEKRAVIETKVSFYERVIEETKKRLAEIERSENFWFRLRNVF